MNIWSYVIWSNFVYRNYVLYVKWIISNDVQILFFNPLPISGDNNIDSLCDVIHHSFWDVNLFFHVLGFFYEWGSLVE